MKISECILSNKQPYNMSTEKFQKYRSLTFYYLTYEQQKFNFSFYCRFFEKLEMKTETSNFQQIRSSALQYHFALKTSIILE